MNGPSPMFTAWVVLVVNVVLTGLGLLASSRRWKSLAAIVGVFQPSVAALLPSGLTAKATSSATAHALLAGSGTSRTRASLPVWNQLNDPLPDGNQDAFSTSDCGEECVAEVVYGLRGVVVSAGAIRYMLGGALRTGLSTAADLVSVLRIDNIPSAGVSCGWADALPLLERQSVAGQPSILLGTWLGGSALHWVVATTVADGVLHFNDPWGGSRRKMAYSDALPLYQGSLVLVSDPIAYPSA